MFSKAFFPNALTLLNLFCGLLLLFILPQLEFPFLGFSKVYLIAFLMGLSLLFDLFDGLVARAMGVASELGVQLDSLADLISFGVVPGFLMQQSLFALSDNLWFSSLGFIITLFSAFRLAKFNIDTEQTYYFKGLATPAHTLFILGIYAWLQKGELELSAPILLGIIALSSLCMLLPIPLFSFKRPKEKTSFVPQALLIGGAMVLFYFFGICGFAFLIPLYLLLSLLFKSYFIHG